MSIRADGSCRLGSACCDWDLTDCYGERILTRTSRPCQVRDPPLHLPHLDQAAAGRVVPRGISKVELCKNISTALIALHLAGCPARQPATAEHTDAAEIGPTALELPPREVGPARPETEAQVARERREARELTQALRHAVSARQLTSMADIRGYRLYRERRYRRAQVWFETAVQLDPSYELSQYSAARVAALLDDLDRAREHLAQLRRQDTPLARRALLAAERDPDLAALRSVAAPP